MELAVAFFEDEERLHDKKIAKIEAKGDKARTDKRIEKLRIEKRRREVKENLAKLKEKRDGKVASPTERNVQEVENRQEV